MLRRIIGFLMLLALLFPPLVGAAAFLTVNGFLGNVQAAYDARLVRVQTTLDQLEFTVNTATSRYDALRTVAEQVRAAAQAAAQEAAAIDNFNVQSAGGAPLSLDMGAVRGHLQNLYNTLASLATAVSDAAVINTIPGQLGQSIGELQGWYSDVTGILASYGQIFGILAIMLVVWLVLMYLVMVYRWGRQGWAFLTGQPERQFVLQPQVQPRVQPQPQPLPQAQPPQPQPQPQMPPLQQMQPQPAPPIQSRLQPQPQPVPPQSQPQPPQFEP